MAGTIKIKKGHDIKMLGRANEHLATPPEIKFFAIDPTDFQGLIPKLPTKPGDKVKAGTPLFYDKANPEVKFVSPVSGVVEDVVRGERRKILSIVIASDGKNEKESFGKLDLSKMSADEIRQKMLDCGVWPFIKRRPYDIVALPQDKPKAIFVSGFDSAPLAPNYDYILSGKADLVQFGIDVLAKMTGVKVHLSTHAKSASKVLNGLKGVEHHVFDGPHPAGNVGVQINKISPINKGEVVWVVNPQDLITIGKLFAEGIYDAKKFVAVTGSEVVKPSYVEVYAGASVEPILKGNLKVDHKLRIISGNVLTGKKIALEGTLGFYHHQITVIPEGDTYDFLGWAMPAANKYSLHKNVLNSLLPRKEMVVDANLHGGKRAFTVSGEYEKVFPMDIYPEFLLKAIITEDIDKMEQLGIYEVAPEDFALCEFICTSKMELQSIVRKGLDLMYKELS